jgi:hypothetical protein
MKAAVIRRWSRTAAAAIASVVGLDELVLVLGLVLVTVALWPLVGRVALIVPGAAAVWVSLPPRARFGPPKDGSTSVRKGRTWGS